jgi:2-iminobutanoate/2-iminopropanoate deaminase
MAKCAIQSKRGAPPRGASSQGWRAGDFIFVTGTGPIDPSTGNLVGDTIEQQTEQTIDNISAILEADGASLSDVVMVTVHLSDTSHFARYNSVYARRFSQPYGAHHGWQRSRPCSRNADRNRWHPPQTEKNEQEETAHCKEEGGAPKSVD